MNKVELYNVYKALCDSNSIPQSERTQDFKKISDLPEGAIYFGFYERQYEIKFEFHIDRDKRKHNYVFNSTNTFENLGQMYIVDRRR